MKVATMMNATSAKGEQENEGRGESTGTTAQYFKYLILEVLLVRSLT